MQVRKMASSRGNVYLVKIGRKPAGDGSQEIGRIKKVIWDQLLDTKAEIIQRKLYFRFACIMPELSVERLTRGHNKGF